MKPIPHTKDEIFEKTLTSWKGRRFPIITGHSDVSITLTPNVLQANHSEALNKVFLPLRVHIVCIISGNIISGRVVDGFPSGIPNPPDAPPNGYIPVMFGEN